MRFLSTLAALLVSALSVHAFSGLSGALYSSSALSTEQMENMFTAWMKQHNKVYSFEEFSGRFQQFQVNVEAIRQHNTRAEATYRLDLNQFADLSMEEFKAKYFKFHGIEGNYIRSKNLHRPLLGAPALPSSIDWRTLGAVSPVQDEGQVSADWAFSAAEAIEGAWVTQGKHSLSSIPPQQLVDCCSTTAGNVDGAFECAIAAGGVCTSYSTGQCNSCQRVVTVSGYKDIVAGDENALLNAVGNVGPVSVAVEADSFAFQFYVGGVLSGSCGTKVNHAVLAVGYGTDNGQDYWIVKNSWGTSWGENGYIRLIRNHNQCGIAQAASYPTV